jgi:hypothetical protein
MVYKLEYAGKKDILFSGITSPKVAGPNDFPRYFPNSFFNRFISELVCVQITSIRGAQVSSMTLDVL